MVGKKKASPKKVAKKKSKVAKPVCYSETPSANIRKADNGFVVSSYGSNGETVKIAKTEKEAVRFATSML